MRVYIFILFLLGWVAMKLSLPLLPILSSVLHTNPSLIKLSVTIYLSCFAVSQLVWSGLSEKYGRRKIVIIALSIASAGSLLTATSSTIAHFLVARCIEATGISVASPLARAIIGDVYTKKEIPRVLPIGGCINGLMPFLAPVVGGYIFFYLGWRSVYFSFLGLTWLFIAWAILYMPETNKTKHHYQRHSDIVSSYLHIIRNKLFWKYVTGYAIAQGILVGYYSAMPFWYVDQLHYSEKIYPFLASITVFMYLCGLLSMRYFSAKINPALIYRTCLKYFILLSCLSIVFALARVQGTIAIVIVISLFAIIPGIAFPSANTILISEFNASSAMVSALSSTVMFFSAATFSFIESHLSVQNLWQFAILLSLCSLIAFFSNCVKISQKVGQSCIEASVLR